MRWILCLLPLAAVVALDRAAGDLSWADRPFRPTWRLTPLGTALDDVLKPAGITVSASPAAKAGLAAWTVTLQRRAKVPLVQTLADIEELLQLHLTVEPLRLVILTRAEFDDRRRRPVAIDLRESGLFVRGFSDAMRPLGLGTYPGRNLGVSYFSGGPERPKPATVALPTAIEALLQSHDEIDGQLTLLATPEEEALARRLLDDAGRQARATTTWVVSTGVLPPDAVGGGVMTSAQAQALAGRLQQADERFLTCRYHQIVSAGNLVENGYFADIDVVSRSLDPTIKVLATGRQVQLEVQPGVDRTLVNFAADWCEPRGRATAEVTAPPLPAQAPVIKEGAAEPLASSPGQTLTIDLPQAWTWHPRAECWLGVDQALVLVAPRGADRVAAILRRVAP